MRTGVEFDRPNATDPISERHARPIAVTLGGRWAAIECVPGVPGVQSNPLIDTRSGGKLAWARELAAALRHLFSLCSRPCHTLWPRPSRGLENSQPCRSGISAAYPSHRRRNLNRPLQARHSRTGERVHSAPREAFPTATTSNRRFGSNQSWEMRLRSLTKVENPTGRRLAGIFISLTARLSEPSQTWQDPADRRMRQWPIDLVSGTRSRELAGSHRRPSVDHWGVGRPISFTTGRYPGATTTNSPVAQIKCRGSSIQPGLHVSLCSQYAIGTIRQLLCATSPSCTCQQSPGAAPLRALRLRAA